MAFLFMPHKSLNLIISFGRIQTTGLGGLKPNSVIFGWPHGWRQNTDDDKSWRIFIDAIYATAANKMALIVPKGISFFPESTEKVRSLFGFFKKLPNDSSFSLNRSADLSMSGGSFTTEAC